MKVKPSTPPPMRMAAKGAAVDRSGMWIVLLFVAGMAVGSKMVGGW
jgi:hypothetical protein